MLFYPLTEMEKIILLSPTYAYQVLSEIWSTKQPIQKSVTGAFNQDGCVESDVLTGMQTDRLPCPTMSRKIMMEG